MVSNGSWKDYSFSSCTKEVSFDVYQRASEKPFLRITKNSSGYHLNNGGYSRGIQFDNLHSLSIYLASKVQDLNNS